MSDDKDGGLAFPGRRSVELIRVVDGGKEYHMADYGGMSLRDWFAGQSAAAIIGGMAAACVATEPGDAEKLARAAYLLADAMLEARK